MRNSIVDGMSVFDNINGVVREGSCHSSHLLNHIFICGKSVEKDWGVSKASLLQNVSVYRCILEDLTFTDFVLK